MEYSELEKKVIDKGRTSFIKELQEASKPMLAVLKKYRVLNKHKLLDEIKLCYPNSNNQFYNYAVNVPYGKNLEILDSIILDHFMEEITELKERVNDIEI